MKRKTTRTSSSALKSSSSSQQTVTSYYLPDECWESIFRFIIDDGNENCNNNNNHNYSCLNYLSVVSKQFLTITNRLLLSFAVHKSSTDFHGLFKRFTNLNSLNIKRHYDEIDLDTLLLKISCFPLKLTSLNISCQFTIPANGLRDFSKKITTLTSLDCSNIHFLNTSDLFLIAECFPLLEQLDLSYPLCCNDYSRYVDGVEALSLALIKLRKVNLSRFPINDQSLFHLFNSCKHLDEVIMFGCKEITYTGLASALRERPTLRSLSFSFDKAVDSNVFNTTHFINSLVSLKGLTSLVLPNLFISDEHVVQLSSLFSDLVSINLSGCPKLTKSALFTLAKNCPSLSEIKMERIGSNSVQNSDSLVEFGVYPQLKSLYLGRNSWLSDESIIMFASVFPNLQLLDLSFCYDISEGICQLVLRKYCKIRHLNLAYCYKVKLHGMNFVVPNLEVLNLSSTKVDDETLYVISKNCCGLLELLLVSCNGFTNKGVKHVVEKCTKLRKIIVSCYSLSDKNRKHFSRHGCQILNY